ncbi:unnamed protein product [Linum trigynum]|uniref:Uncharacterized protein n=1 Tax=Linum trigynum TaxID=586398 RepID=A0AAV2CVL1_9ROSI
MGEQNRFSVLNGDGDNGKSGEEGPTQQGKEEELGKVHEEKRELINQTMQQPRPEAGSKGNEKEVLMKKDTQHMDNVPERVGAQSKKNLSDKLTQA